MKNKWVITINGKKYTTAQVAKMLGLYGAESVVLAIGRYNGNPAAFRRWVLRRLYAVKHGIGPNDSWFFRDDGTSYFLVDIMHTAGISMGSAYKRGKRWEEWEITTKEFFAPAKGKKSIVGNAAWVALGNRPRNENMERIPSPTKHDKALKGTPKGFCCPSELNQQGHGRY